MSSWYLDGELSTCNQIVFILCAHSIIDVFIFSLRNLFTMLVHIVELMYIYK